MDKEYINKLHDMLKGNNYKLEITELNVFLNVKYYPINIPSGSVSSIIETITSNNLLSKEIKSGYSEESFNLHKKLGEKFYSVVNGGSYRTSSDNVRLISNNLVYDTYDDYASLMKSVNSDYTKGGTTGKEAEANNEKIKRKLFIDLFERKIVENTMINTKILNNEGIGFSSSCKYIKLTNTRDPKIIRFLLNEMPEYLTKSNEEEISLLSNEFFKNLELLNIRNREEFKGRKKAEYNRKKASIANDKRTAPSDDVSDFIKERRAGKFNVDVPESFFEHNEKDFNLTNDVSNELDELIKGFDTVLNPENKMFIDLTKAYKLNYEKVKGNTTSFDDVVKERTESIKGVLISKAKEYASDNNRFYNFEEAGRMKGETAEKALYGMQAKHLVSVKKIIDDIENDGKYPSVELLNEKIGDSINYFILLEGLIKSKI